MNLINYPTGHYNLDKIINANNVRVIENKFNYFPKNKVMAMISNAGRDKVIKAINFKVPIIAIETDISENTFCR